MVLQRKSSRILWSLDPLWNLSLSNRVKDLYHYLTLSFVLELNWYFVQFSCLSQQSVYTQTGRQREEVFFSLTCGEKVCSKCLLDHMSMFEQSYLALYSYCALITPWLISYRFSVKNQTFNNWKEERSPVRALKDSALGSWKYSFFFL